MEIVFLPAWANICVIVAVLGLIGLFIGPKFKVKKITITNTKATYYIASASVVVALGAFFALMSDIHITGKLLTAFAVIEAVGTIVAGISCLADESTKHVPAIGGIVVILLVFTTLAFANVGYATVWLAVLSLLLFIERVLFPSPKKKKD